jgi:hypothetical protein
LGPKGEQARALRQLAIDWPVAYFIDSRRSALFCAKGANTWRIFVDSLCCLSEHRGTKTVRAQTTLVQLVKRLSPAEPFLLCGRILVLRGRAGPFRQTAMLPESARGHTGTRPATAAHHTIVGPSSLSRFFRSS